MSDRARAHARARAVAGAHVIAANEAFESEEVEVTTKRDGVVTERIYVRVP